MRGRHSTDEDGRRWAPNALRAASACAPMAALLGAVGAGGVGYLSGRADLAAVGAAAGVVGVGLERAVSRSARRHLRQDRARMRADLRALELTIERLERELAAAPSVLRPEPPPAPTTGPLPLVGASGRAAAPATPRSLPILTANRRGLQSLTPASDLAPAAPSWPALPGWLSEPVVPAAAAFLPTQRPPATPITGLRLPPRANPALTVLEPGPVAPVWSNSGVPRLSPGPSQPVPSLARDRVVDLRAIPDRAQRAAGRHTA